MQCERPTPFLVPIQVLEVQARGVFQSPWDALQFNAITGQDLYLHRYRTSLKREQFLSTFFSSEGEGAFLERCCGTGNVEIEISSPFSAYECLVGSSTELNKLTSIFEERERNGFWNRSIYKSNSLLSLPEILAYAINPFKAVFVRHFGLVSELKVNALLELERVRSIDRSIESL